MIYRLRKVMYSSTAVGTSQICIETVGDCLVGDCAHALMSNEPSSLGIVLFVGGIIDNAGEIHPIFEFSYHHIRNLESKSSVIASRLSILLTTESKPMPLAHRVSWLRLLAMP